MNATLALKSPTPPPADLSFERLLAALRGLRPIAAALGRRARSATRGAWRITRASGSAFAAVALLAALSAVIGAIAVLVAAIAAWIG